MSCKKDEMHSGVWTWLMSKRYISVYTEFGEKTMFVKWNEKSLSYFVDTYGRISSRDFFLKR